MSAALELDRLLNEPGRADLDPALTRLAALADDLHRSFAVEVPGAANMERARFVEGISLAPRAPQGWRRLTPSIAIACMLAIVSVAGSRALPGGPFYLARELLEAVGVAPDPAEDLDRRIHRARSHVVAAESEEDPGAARRLARLALRELSASRLILERVDIARRGTRLVVIEGLERRAIHTLFSKGAFEEPIHPLYGRILGPVSGDTSGSRSGGDGSAHNKTPGNSVDEVPGADDDDGGAGATEDPGGEDPENDPTNGISGTDGDDVQGIDGPEVDTVGGSPDVGDTVSGVDGPEVGDATPKVEPPEIDTGGGKKGINPGDAVPKVEAPTVDGGGKGLGVEVPGG